MKKQMVYKKSDKKVISTRLGLDEIRFLKNIGNGDLTAGVRVALERAGYSVESEKHRGYRVICERTSEADGMSSRYTLFLNGEMLGVSLNISDSIFKALMERFGKVHVMEELIINSFVKLPREVDIDKIYDLDGRVVWSKYSE